jgi:hypothetical protein
MPEACEILPASNWRKTISLAAKLLQKNQHYSKHCLVGGCLQAIGVKTFR